ncbi:hypothetical protein DPMN_120869 [Dreissena polymorpha]|uniref:Uncharacterized protein n=1 Tax=Dreissena polymorpha TaxID=45954 RepID=A0A9D4GKL5_DREPO|nr:hypothetical protein DPMN_120869 [Dreissena polymorpha]
MTCKLALTRMSTTEDVQAGSDSVVHNRCQMGKLALPQICTQKMMFKLGTLLQL